MTAHPALLNTLGYHDNIVNILLPCHLPELIFGARQRALSRYVLPAETVALQVERTPLVSIKAEKKIF